MSFDFILYSEVLHIYRFHVASPIPPRIFDSSFFAISKSSAELSVVTDLKLDGYERVEENWKRFSIAGVLDFSLTGVISGISVLLADHGISIFVVSSFDTDHLLVRVGQVENVHQILKQAGHFVSADE